MIAPSTIVIAEDSRLQGRILKNALETAGYVVHWGANGSEALALIREHRPVLVVSDVEPGIGGTGTSSARARGAVRTTTDRARTSDVSMRGTGIPPMDALGARSD